MKIVVVGLQWGDEGKGKVVSHFSRKFDWIVRYSGGSNAGHTVHMDGKKYVNHLLPCVDPRGKSKGYLGPGMVLNLERLVNEIESLERIFPGISKRFYLDLNATLVLSWHIVEDELIENMRMNPIGTTKNGIGPAYKDKVSRDGIKLYHLFDESSLSSKLEELYHLKTRFFGENLEKPESLKRRLLEDLEKLGTMGVKFTTTMDMRKEFEGSKILFEGSQGVLLDVNFGTYPYVTSSSCTSWGIFEGFQFLKIDETIGVFKAYVTRVGNGPFPTEMEDQLEDTIRRKGMEYGATTGRPRRIGWLDLPALRYSIISSNVSELVLTKADVLNGLDRLKICTQYDVEGELKEIPTTPEDFEKAKPIYREIDGWKDLKDGKFEEFVRMVETELRIKINYVSYGPGSDEIFER